MSSSVAQAVHLLKQENSQLKERVIALEEENKALQSYLKGLSALYEATLTIAHQDNLFKILDETLYQALVVLNAEHGSILLVDEETEELVFVLVHGDLRDTLQGYRMNWHQGIAGWVVEYGKPLIVEHPPADPRFFRQVDLTFGVSSHNILAVPMIAGKKILGVIELVNKRGSGQFTESDTTMLSLLALFAATSLDQLNRQLAEEEEVPHSGLPHSGLPQS